MTCEHLLGGWNNSGNFVTQLADFNVIYTETWRTKINGGCFCFFDGIRFLTVAVQVED